MRPPVVILIGLLLLAAVLIPSVGFSGNGYLFGPLSPLPPGLTPAVFEVRSAENPAGGEAGGAESGPGHNLAGPEDGAERRAPVSYPEPAENCQAQADPDSSEPEQQAAEGDKCRRAIELLRPQSFRDYLALPVTTGLKVPPLPRSLS